MGLAANGPWALRATVVSVLQARTGLRGPDTLVRLGLPTGAPSDAVTRRVYVLAESTPDQAEPKWAGGNEAPQDTLQVGVTVLALTFGSDQDGSAAETLITGIVSELEAQLDDDPEWGGVCVASGLSLRREATNPTPDGWVSQADLTLHFRTW
jgi:hypothetical protein